MSATYLPCLARGCRLSCLSLITGSFFCHDLIAFYAQIHRARGGVVAKKRKVQRDELLQKPDDLDEVKEIMAMTKISLQGRLCNLLCRSVHPYLYFV